MFNMNDINIANDVAAEEDKLGGFELLESGVYQATIEYAYGHISSGGAQAISVAFKVGKDGYSLNRTFYITNKKKEAYYTDKSGQKHFLPGFNLANALVYAATGKELPNVEIAERTLPIYDFNQRKEVPTQVQALIELAGAKVALGIQKVRANKRVKLQDGSYGESNEETFFNEIDRVFTLQDGNVLTLQEAKANAAPEFAAKWADKWNGKVNDKYKEVQGSTSSQAGSSAPLNIG